LLYFGAEWFVGGASALALALRVPQLIVGLTVVAYGTSAPEVIVSVQAASKGHGEVALGNVIGSNIANIGLILGLSTLLRPARVDGALRRRELPVLLASALLLVLMLLDGAVSPLEAVSLLSIAVGYTLVMIRTARAESVRAATAEAKVTADVADRGGAPQPGGVAKSAAVAAGGLGVLLWGGNLFVDGAVAVASSLGMSERLVGLTIVAVGTSLPELVTSLIAARRGHSDIAVGNVVGSNIFNVFLCLGASGLAGPVVATLASLRLELVALVVMTALAALFVRTERTMTRLEGGALLALYVVFSTAVVFKG
jgi:cation:H+ antiporter